MTTTALKKGNGHGKKCTPNFDHRVLDTKTETMQEAEAIQEVEEEVVEMVEEVELEEKDLVELSQNH